MENESWLRAVLDACRAELEQAEAGESGKPDDYVVDLKRVIEQLEKRLARSRIRHR
jgi:hypothetical protein